MDTYNSEISNIYFEADGPISVSIDVTKQCNFRCLHCYNKSGEKPQDEIDDIELMKVIKQIANFHCSNVCLCGGEPLLRKNIYDIIKCLSTSSAYVNLVSNGSLIDDNVANKLKEHGLYLIQFSLDGINPLQHDNFRQYKGSFKKVISAIKSAIKVGLVVAVSFSPNKLNFNDFDKYVEMCVGLGVNEIRTMPLIPMGRGTQIDNWLLSSEDYVVFQQKIIKTQNKYKNRVSIEWGDPLDHYQRMPNNYKLGIKTCSMQILSNGDITPSTYLPINFGNIRSHSLLEYWDSGFDEIWGNEEYLKVINRIENIYDIHKLTLEIYDKDLVTQHII